MEVSLDKSSSFNDNLDEAEVNLIQEIFPLRFGSLNDAFKYLRLFLELNDYEISNWLWLVKKVGKCICHWCNHLISLGGHLIFNEIGLGRNLGLLVDFKKFLKIF